MPNKKISELPASNALTGAEILELVQGGINKQTTAQDIADLADGGGAVDSVNGQTGVVVLDKSDVGLSNADNTSDVNKPVSTAQQTALDLKAPLASPALTGTPTAPTPTAGDSSTLIATTAFVQTELGFAFVSVTGAVTLDNTAFGKMHLCSGTATNYTIALPTAVGNANKSIGFKGVGGLTKTVTIDGNGGETIDLEDSREFTAGGLFVVLSDGTNWNIVAEVGSWVPYTPVWTGVSADPTVAEAKYFRVGKLVTVKVRSSGNGTSNATTKTVTVPFNASSVAQFGLSSIIMNNTATQVTPGFIITRANSNVIDLYRDSNSTAWTNTGGFRASFTLIYEKE